MSTRIRLTPRANRLKRRRALTDSDEEENGYADAAVDTPTSFTLQSSDEDMDVESNKTLHSSPDEGMGMESNPLDAGSQDPSCNTMAGVIGMLHAGQTAATERHRLVQLSLKTSASTSLILAVPRFVLRAIPEYATKLEKAIQKTDPSKRIAISDSKIRPCETMLQVVEYLTYGILLPSTPESMCDDTLNQLLQLYDMSIVLRISRLEDAVGNRIIDFIPVERHMFFYFAEQCYSDKHRLSLESTLGQRIKCWLADNLHELADCDAMDQLKGIPKLNSQIIEVYTEAFKTSKPSPPSSMTVQRDNHSDAADEIKPDEPVGRGSTK